MHPGSSANVTRALHKNVDEIKRVIRPAVFVKRPAGKDYRFFLHKHAALNLLYRIYTIVGGLVKLVSGESWSIPEEPQISK